MRLVALLALLAASCNTAVPVEPEWRVEVRTEGGITGRGVGAMSVDTRSIEARDMGGGACHGTPSGEEADAIASAVTAATPDRWPPATFNPQAADMIHYRLELRRGDASYSISFDDEEAIPKDAAALFRAVWRARDRILRSCSER